MRRISGAILVGAMVVLNGVSRAQEPFESSDDVAEPQTQVEQQEGPAIDYAVYLESGEKTARDKRFKEKFEKTLNDPLKAPLQIEDLPISELMNQISAEYELPIIFDIAALDALAVSPDTEVTINLRNTSLRQALNLVLRQPGLEDLTYIFEDGVLLITTEEKANESLRIRVYRVDDLVQKYDLASSNKPYSSLIQVITSSVEFNSWLANCSSGEGEILLMQPGMLIVSQTERVHQQIQELLGLIRYTAAEIEKPKGSTEATAAASRNFEF